MLTSEDPRLVHLRLPVADLDDHLLARLVPHHSCMPHSPYFFTATASMQSGLLQKLAWLAGCASKGNPLYDGLGIYYSAGCSLRQFGQGRITHAAKAVGKSELGIYTVSPAALHHLCCR